METSNLEKALEILRKLSPQNQRHLMAMLRVAQAAEKGAKEADNPSKKSRMKSSDPLEQTPKSSL